MKKLIAIILSLALLVAFAACGKQPPAVNPALVLGEKYLLDLDYEQALLQFEQAIKIEPKNPRIQVQIEYIYLITEDSRADPEKLAGKHPDLFPNIPPKPVDEPTRVNWLLALIEALKKLNVRDHAVKLLEHLAAQFPSYEQVVAAYKALKDELGIAAETIGGAVMTTVTTTTAEKPTATTKEETTSTITTTKPTAGKIELSNYNNMPADELARVLGCGISGTSDEVQSYAKEDHSINVVNISKDGSVYTEVSWHSSNVSIYGISIDDTLNSAIQKLASNGYSSARKDGDSYSYDSPFSMSGWNRVMLHTKSGSINGITFQRHGMY